MDDDMEDETLLDKDNFINNIDLIFDNAELEDQGSNFKEKNGSYPEVLLQNSKDGYRLNNAFQSLSKQFIEDKTLGNLIWNKCKTKELMKSMINEWSQEQYNRSNDSNSQKMTEQESKNSGKNKLFSWSTGDRVETKVSSEDVASKNSLFSPMEANVKKAEMSKKDTDDANMELRALLGKSKSKVGIAERLSSIIEKQNYVFFASRMKEIEKLHDQEVNRQIHQRREEDKQLEIRRQLERAGKTDFSETSPRDGSRSTFLGLFGITTSRQKESVSNKSTIKASSSSDSKKNKRFSFMPPSMQVFWGQGQHVEDDSGINEDIPNSDDATPAEVSNERDDTENSVKDHESSNPGNEIRHALTKEQHNTDQDNEPVQHEARKPGQQTLAPEMNHIVDGPISKDQNGNLHSENFDFSEEEKPSTTVKHENNNLINL